MKFKADSSDTTWYNYDNLGNLISVVLPDGTFIEYIIDGQNRRIGEKVNGEFKKGWIYQDQINPIAEFDGAGNLVARFVYGDKGHVPSYMIKGGDVYRIITDHLGSVRLVVNVSTGQVMQEIAYDEFGNVLSNSNPEFQPFGYAGGLYDETTGLVRFGARDYDANVGRWTVKDPMVFAGRQLNIYSYVLNNPINYIDPIGFYLVPVNLPGLGNTYLDNTFVPMVTNFIRYAADEGVALNFESAYRTPKKQAELRRKYGERAAKKSLHSAGFAVDVTYLNLQGDECLSKSEKQAIINNAARKASLSLGAGFSKPEPWHFYHDPGGDRSELIDEATAFYNHYQDMNLLITEGIDAITH